MMTFERPVWLSHSHKPRWYIFLLVFLVLLTCLLSAQALATTSCPQPEPPATPNAKTASSQQRIDDYDFSYKQYRVRMNMHQQCVNEFWQTSLRKAGNDPTNSRAAIAKVLQSQQEHSMQLTKQVIQADREYRIFIGQLQQSGKGPSNTQQTVASNQGNHQGAKSGGADGGVGNPCSGEPKFHRRQQTGTTYRRIYNGVANIRHLPSKPVAISNEIPVANPSCVKMGFTVFGEGEQRQVAELALLAITGPVVSSDDPYVAAATNAIKMAVREDLFPEKTKEGWNYEVNIPVWREHSLFSGQNTHIAKTDLAHLGYYDAEKVNDIDNMQIFRVANRHQGEDIFVVIKKFQPDEPIEKPQAEMFSWFHQYVAPYAKGDPRTSHAAATVYFYDKEVLYDAREQSDNPVGFYPPETMDPANHQPVARALKSFTFHGRRVNLGSPVEWGRLTNNRSDPYTTLAKIQEQSDKLEQIVENQQAYFRQNAAARPAVNTQQLAYQERIKTDSATAAAQGLIYRPPSYWATFASFPEMGQIFNGAKEHRKALEHSIVYMEIYMRYQAHFAANCPALIPKGAPGYYYKTTTEYSDSMPISTYSDTVYVRPEYWEKFNEFLARTGRAYSGNFAAASMDFKESAQMGMAVARNIMGVNRDLERIFQESDCNSGFQQQFSENLRRLAYGEKTLQMDTAAKFTFAAQDTSKHKVKPSLAGVCFDAVYGQIDSTTIKWCQCLEQKFQSVLSSSEMADAIANYDGFKDKIHNVPATPRDPLWRYYETAGACKN